MPSPWPFDPWRLPDELWLDKETDQLCWEYEDQKLYTPAPSWHWDDQAGWDARYEEVKPWLVREDGKPYARLAGGSLLEQFLRFRRRGVPPLRFFEFARRFGVLHLQYQHAERERRWKGSDSLKTWRNLARYLTAIRDVANALHNGREPRAGDLKWLAPHEDPELALGLALRRSILPHVEVVMATPRKGERLQPLLGGRTLRGALATELVLALAGPPSARRQCDGCGQLHMSKARRGERSYCEDCRETGKPVRAAKHDYRQRLKKGTSLLRKGVPVEEIARRVGSRVSTVQRWAEQRVTR